MELLTGKQKRVLRSRGQTLDAITMIGKQGLNESSIAHLQRLLEGYELIKVRLLDIQGAERKILAQELAKATNTECVGVVGKTVLLFRANEKLPHSERIHLPR